MDTLNIKERVINCLSRSLDWPESELTISLEKDLYEDFNCDDIAVTAIKLEEEFGIEVPDEDADEWTTPQSIIDYIDKCQAK